MQDSVCSVGNSGFAVDLTDIVLDRTDSKKKRLCDFLIAFSLHKQMDYILFTLRKIGKSSFRLALFANVPCDFGRDISR